MVAGPHIANFSPFSFFGKGYTSLIGLHCGSSNVISTNAGQSDYLLPLVPISTLSGSCTPKKYTQVSPRRQTKRAAVVAANMWLSGLRS